VVGYLWVPTHGEPNVAFADLPDIGLKDGDEVEVTIRKHEPAGEEPDVMTTPHPRPLSEPVGHHEPGEKTTWPKTT
jgi:hypothetical protein